MFNLLSFIIISLQIYCLYQVYTRKSSPLWYVGILFFPLVGCLFYLYRIHGSQPKFEDLSEGINLKISRNKRISQLENLVSFSDTVVNKVNLADEYSTVGKFTQAIELYKSCLDGIYKDDPDLLMKLVKNSFFDKDYVSSIKYAEPLKDEKLFANSEARIAYAWSLYFEGKIEAADQTFKNMDKGNTNFVHRFEYAKFLNIVDRKEDCKQILNELVEEIESMNHVQKKLNVDISRSIEALKREVQ